MKNPKHAQAAPLAAEPDAGESLIQRELEPGAIPDERPGRRPGRLPGQFADGTAESVPSTCQDWANTKAAHRFFANERVTEEDIQAGHFRGARGRFGGASGAMPVPHDTTRLSCRRENVGWLHRPRHGPSDRWRKAHPVCGISPHSSPVLTPADLPPGLAAVTFWTRAEFKGANALKRKINPARIPIGEKESLSRPPNLRHAAAPPGEPARCVHVGDRLFPVSPVGAAAPRSLGLYIGRIARLGGYLARARDPAAPGNIVMWRGLPRLNDLVFRYALDRAFAGN